MTKYCIILHGGAGSYPSSKSSDDCLIPFNDSVIEIVKKGAELLENGGSALDAVEVCVKGLEDDPLYNAGTGCCLTSNGTVELDAFIMNGSNFGVGAVGCVDCAKNPISLARLVMEKSPHCMFVGDGAKRFAQSQGYKILESPEELITERAKNDLKTTKDFNTEIHKHDNPKLNIHCSDTVGAVALDRNGNIACGTSTGGINAKLPGRIGDVPLIGCGGFATENGGASCTGHGESLLKTMCCKNVVDLMEQGQNPKLAAQTALKNMFDKVNGRGGVICLNKKGEIGISFTTEFMPWAYFHSENGLKTFYTMNN